MDEPPVPPVAVGMAATSDGAGGPTSPASPSADRTSPFPSSTAALLALDPDTALDRWARHLDDALAGSPDVAAVSRRHHRRGSSGAIRAAAGGGEAGDAVAQATFAKLELELENERLHDELALQRARMVELREELEEQAEVVVMERDRFSMELQLAQQQLRTLRTQNKQLQRKMDTLQSARSPTASSTSPPPAGLPSTPDSASSAPTARDPFSFREIERLREAVSRLSAERDSALGRVELLETDNVRMRSELAVLQEHVNASREAAAAAGATADGSPRGDGSGEQQRLQAKLRNFQLMLIDTKMELAEAKSKCEEQVLKLAKYERLLVDTKLELAETKSTAEDRLDAMQHYRQQAMQASPASMPAASPDPGLRSGGGGDAGTSGGVAASKPPRNSTWRDSLVSSGASLRRLWKGSSRS